MKILVIDLDNPYRVAPGGQFALTKEYVFPIAQKHQLKILSHYASGSKTNYYQGIEYLSLGSKFMGSIGFILAARAYVKKDRWHDLIIEKFTSPIGPIGLPNLTNKPVIGEADFVFWREMASKYKLPINRLTERLIRQYEVVVTRSHAAGDFIETISPTSRVVIFAHSSPLIKKGRPNKGKTNLLYMGRPDWHQKGLDLLLSALNQLRVNELSIQIAGFDQNHPTWQKLRKRYQPRVKIQLLGYIAGQAKQKALNDCYCMLVPSRYEAALPVSAFEGASVGKPAVTFNLPVYNEYASGILASTPFDTSQFARNIERLLTDRSLYNSLAKEMVRLTTKQSSIDYRQKYQDFIEEIVKE